jgi:hydrogenase maturation protein HypF
MAEHGLDEHVIGISMDGVGYGLDGNIWGLEILLCDLVDLERRSHLEYVLQPGGDMSNHEPWRMGYSFLHQYVRRDPEALGMPFLKDTGREKIEVIRAALENKINTPLTSSAGRLFDAVAAITGVCTHSVFHAEAPMRLENIIDLSEHGEYEFECGQVISPALVIQRITEDVLNKVPAGKISARFHRAVVKMIVRSAVDQRDVNGIGKVVLSGGSFQNRFLLSEAERKLKQEGFRVYSHQQIPSNDGGIALGQLVIAAKKRSAGYI